MGAVHVELDQDLVAVLEELHRPVKEAARELIVLEPVEAEEWEHFLRELGREG